MFRIAALLHFRGAGLELDMSVYGCISTAPAEGMLEARSRAASRVRLIRTPANVKTRAQLNTPNAHVKPEPPARRAFKTHKTCLIEAGV